MTWRKIVAASVLVLFAGILDAPAQTLPPEKEADRLIVKAKRKLDKKDYRGAVEIYERILGLEVRPRELDFYWHYGNALFEIGRLKQARTLLNTYVRQGDRTDRFFLRALEQLNDIEDKLEARDAEENRKRAEREQACKSLKYRVSLIEQLASRFNPDDLFFTHRASARHRSENSEKIDKHSQFLELLPTCRTRARAVKITDLTNAPGYGFDVTEKFVGDTETALLAIPDGKRCHYRYQDDDRHCDAGIRKVDGTDWVEMQSERSGRSRKQSRSRESSLPLRVRRSEWHDLTRRLARGVVFCRLTSGYRVSDQNIRWLSKESQSRPMRSGKSEILDPIVSAAFAEYRSKCWGTSGYTERKSSCGGMFGCTNPKARKRRNSLSDMIDAARKPRDQPPAKD